MVFSSVEFLFYFLPVFLFIYIGLPWKNAIFLIASLLFYSWGEGIYVLLLLFSGIINYLMSIWMDKTSGSRRKLWLIISISINVIVLIFFKYLDFIIDNVNIVSSIFNFNVNRLNIHLPIGISFFTFQAISYLFDVYRREVTPEKNPGNVLLYMAMFPHQLAGPIVRYSQVIDKLRDRTITFDKFSLGAQMFIVGLGQKVLLANTLAVATDYIFNVPDANIETYLAWGGMICYSLQIFFDFSGYSTMAAGLALMFGLFFPRNFDWPYTAQSVTDFWRRWHISLSTWFRDYVYIPMGGNKGSSGKTYANLFLVFVLCGIWHGASWTFLVWGLYHGLFLVFERLYLHKVLQKVPKFIRIIYTLFAVGVGWIIFRSTSFAQAFIFIKAIFGFGTGDGITYHIWQPFQSDVVIALCVGAIVSGRYLALKFPEMAIWPESDKDIPELAAKLNYRTAFILLIILSLSILSLASGAYNPFIYFRF
jgi:alginate O-acetyltransferase complex protein AlgI